jgi:hypothetical protein
MDLIAFVRDTEPGAAHNHHNAKFLLPGSLYHIVKATAASSAQVAIALDRIVDNKRAADHSLSSVLARWR